MKLAKKYIAILLLIIACHGLNGQSILNSRNKDSLNVVNSDLKDFLFVDSAKTYLFVNENDSERIYTLDVLFNEFGRRKLFITISKDGYLKSAHIIEHKFNYFKWDFMEHGNRINGFEFDFFDN